MTAIEIIKDIMNDTDTRVTDFVEYSDMGTKSNVYQMLQRKDLKVESFVKMLDVMGFQLVVKNENTGDETIVNYEEGNI